MIERVIEFSAKHKFLVILLTIVAVIGAIQAMRHTPLDAIPDLSDTQVIIYSRWDRSPDIIEDQVTYPIITAMLGAPQIKAVRGFSDFGFSYVYVIFQDGTDIYWARSRTIEYLSKILPRLPEGVRTELGPDATSVGWVFQYSLVDTSGRNDLAQLRTYQDWYLRYQLQGVPGVAEVASIGGFQKQYQVSINPNALNAYDIALPTVVQAIRDGNNDVGGRVVEFSGAEYMVRGRGYVRSIQDVENIVVGRDAQGTPILVKNLGTVGRYYPEERHPISKRLFRVYEPACEFVLRHKGWTIGGALALMVITVPVYFQLGSEFMPPLDEGSLLYMPTTMPGLSVTEAQTLLQTMDRHLKTFPEVERVFGKAGRAETSTDPAPFSMMEITIVLKPHDIWRKKPRWYSNWPGWLQAPLRHVWPDRLGTDELIAEMDQAMQYPGVVNAWTMPIKARIDMLTTGVRTPVGIKILGADLNEIEQIGTHLETILNRVPGTRSVYAERTGGGYFLDFVLKREQIARYGLTIKEAEMVVMSAIGGDPITTTVEGRERYTISVRYARELRDEIDKLRRVLVPAGGGAHVPLAELADIKLVSGPAMIRDENGLLSGYVYVDLAGRDVGGYVEEAKELVAKEIPLPTGYTLTWSGQYENMLRVRERLKVVVPITIALIFILLYMNTGSAVKAGIVLLAVPFSLIGAVWFLWFLGYNMSIAVWVGMIALMGLDAETGVFMLLFLDLSYHDAIRKGKMKTYDDLRAAIIHGAVKRIRPKLMTVAAAMMGLLPIMWSLGNDLEYEREEKETAKGGGPPRSARQGF